MDFDIVKNYMDSNPYGTAYSSTSSSQGQGSSPSFDLFGSTPSSVPSVSSPVGNIFNSQSQAGVNQRGNIFEDDFFGRMLPQGPDLFQLMGFNPMMFQFDSGKFEFPPLKAKNYTKVPLSDAAKQRIQQIAAKLNCNPKDIEKVIYAESGGNPQAVNPKSGATGLIQFMPKTAASLGVTTQQLAGMTQEQQLDFVEKYLLRAKKQAGFHEQEPIDAGTVYALVFMPAKAKKNVMCTGGSLAHSLNKGLDKDGDNQITKADLNYRMQQIRV